GADRERTHPDRPGTSPGATCGVEDGRRGQQGGKEGNRDDQGRRTGHGVPGDRLGDAGARGGGGERRFTARVLLRAGAHAAFRRRPRRSSSQPDRATGVGGTPAGEDLIDATPSAACNRGTARAASSSAACPSPCAAA